MRLLDSTLFLWGILVLAGVCVAAVSSSDSDAPAFECFSRERLGLLVKAEVTALAWPGDNVSLTLNTTATQANVHLHYVHVSLYSLKENRSEILLSNLSFQENVHLSLGESNFTSCAIAIPGDSMPGLLYGEIEYAWSIEGDKGSEEEADTFPATYVQNKPYQDLLGDYEVLKHYSEALQEDYTHLETNHTDLQQRYEQLSDAQTAQTSATSLMYVFLITTGIFVVTTILLLAKRPKTSAW